MRDYSTEKYRAKCDKGSVLEVSLHKSERPFPYELKITAHDENGEKITDLPAAQAEYPGLYQLWAKVPAALRDVGLKEKRYPVRLDDATLGEPDKLADPVVNDKPLPSAMAIEFTPVKDKPNDIRTAFTAALVELEKQSGHEFERVGKMPGRSADASNTAVRRATRPLAAKSMKLPDLDAVITLGDLNTVLTLFAPPDVREIVLQEAEKYTVKPREAEILTPETLIGNLRLESTLSADERQQLKTLWEKAQSSGRLAQ